MEILVSLLLVGIMSMGIVKSVSTALRTGKYSEFNYIAGSLATTKMEEFAAMHASTIDTSMAGTEENVTWPNFNGTFNRVTTIVVNSDGSRNITVNVSSNSTYAPTSVEFSTVFSDWN